MILETELSPAEIDGLHEVTRHAPAKSGISKKVRDRLVTFGYIEQRIGRLNTHCQRHLVFCTSQKRTSKSISPYLKSLRRGHSPFLARRIHYLTFELIAGGRGASWGCWAAGSRVIDVAASRYEAISIRKVCVLFRPPPR